MRTSLLIVYCGVSVLSACTCGPTGESATPITVTGDITTPTTWPVTSADCDVNVQVVARVKSVLTINPGVKVCFASNTGLLVESAGGLHALGSSTQRITMTGTSAVAGGWKGLAVLSNDVTLDSVDLLYAGADEAFCCGFFDNVGDARAAIVVGDNNAHARFTMKNSSVAYSGHDGLFVFDGSSLPGFSSNTFAGNLGAPLTVPFAVAGDLDAATKYAGTPANSTPLVRVVATSTVTAAMTLHKLDVPWGFSESRAGGIFKTSAALTVEAGNRLQFEANSGLELLEGATFTSMGMASSRVVFTGKTETPGYWKGVVINSTGSLISNTDIRFAGNDEAFCCGYYEAGGDSTKAALILAKGSLVITDSTVTSSANRGVSRLDGTLTQTGSNDFTTGNATPNLL